MKITLLAVGKPKRDAASALSEMYRERLAWPVAHIDLDPKQKSSGKESDAQLLLPAIPKNCFVIALDEKGKNIGSAEFASQIQAWQNSGHSHFCFIIGGADGLHSSILQRADYTLSLGKMTWPHKMVQAMILEQLYRASTIISGHPYHRE